MTASLYQVAVSSAVAVCASTGWLRYAWEVIPATDGEGGLRWSRARDAQLSHRFLRHQGAGHAQDVRGRDLGVELDEVPAVGAPREAPAAEHVLDPVRRGAGPGPGGGAAPPPPPPPGVVGGAAGPTPR